MEQTEAYHTNQRETNRCQRHLQRIVIQSLCIVEYPISKYATCCNDTTVNQKYTPIRERVFGKIPI